MNELKKIKKKIDRLIKKHPIKSSIVQKKTSRSKGGILRAEKMKIPEILLYDLIDLAIIKSGMHKKVSIGGYGESFVGKIKPLRASSEYLNVVKDSFDYSLNKDDVYIYIKNKIDSNVDDNRDKIQAGYEPAIDKFLKVNNKVVMGFEVKAYFENTMLKRACMDFAFTKDALGKSDLTCVLFTLQSQTYDTKENLEVGYNAHTIMSFFKKHYNLDVRIFVLYKEPRIIGEDLADKGYKVDIKRLDLAYKFFYDFLMNQQ